MEPLAAAGGSFSVFPGRHLLRGAVSEAVLLPEPVLRGAVFTLLFSIPIAMLLGALCGGVEDRLGRRLLVLCTALVSLWMGAQTVYYHLFKTF